ncbi:MAG: 1-(5-phosphoribosyl)-5-[(5-phosphoribosylamino)methylideneamino] imidazole-4-carboxamide isomerase [Candidatus Omnitrophica bacterium]|nr:1-(5-phosphoribosyl)-5-[(5-phosphoribosylamino)methylideneamino] imidazole-4-carboxamide isomerase [Candidatus Omnitrophota bacterium]
MVRLIRGEYDREIVYGQDPAEFARRYEEEGAEWVHVVDLDGALHGQARNLDLVKQIREATRLKIEFGGGLRSMEDLERVFSLGVERAVVGTKALDRTFMEAVLMKYGERMAVGVDIKNGWVQTSGWTRESGQTLGVFLDFLNGAGARQVIWTNIARDGMLQGPDLEGLNQVLESAGKIQVILSGGVTSPENIREIAALRHPNLWGFIVGRALYEGQLTVREALSVLRSVE